MTKPHGPASYTMCSRWPRLISLRSALPSDARSPPMLPVAHFAVAAGLGCGDLDAVLVNVQSDVHGGGARFTHSPSPREFATTRPTTGPVHGCSSAGPSPATYGVAGDGPPEFTKPSCLGLTVHTMRLITFALRLFLISVATGTVGAQVRFADPKVVDGKPTCENGYFLIAPDACLIQSALTEYSAEDIAIALMARKNPEAARQHAERLATRKVTGIPVFKTKVSEESGQILKLANNAVVEVGFGYIGYIGYGKTALLFREGATWKIWIEGKKTFSVEVLRPPSGSPRYVTTVSETLELLE